MVQIKREFKFIELGHTEVDSKRGDLLMITVHTVA